LKWDSVNFIRQIAKQSFCIISKNFLWPMLEIWRTARHDQVTIAPCPPDHP
jgi:hypothetical protein